MFFNVDYKSGRLEINKQYEPLAVAFKERAAFSRNMLLAALPAGPYAHQYIAFELGTGKGQLLLARPDSTRLEAQRLWDALHHHFGSELKEPVAVTREDWSRIDQEWKDFLRVRHSQGKAGSTSETTVGALQPTKSYGVEGT